VSARVVEVRWATVTLAEVPPGDDWLGARERVVLAGLRSGPRRDSWRLGRLAAKRLLGAVEILPSREGPPRAFLGAAPVPVSLSISHRDGVGLCAAADGELALGCDLERVEARSAAFLVDFLTPAERAAVATARDPALQANLVWSAKESALKALHTGLARDTFELEVSLKPGAAPWGELVIEDASSGHSLAGVWRRLDDFVLTLVSWPARPEPHPA
jgi:4'-phosphopantetheinyl transferase